MTSKLEVLIYESFLFESNAVENCSFQPMHSSLLPSSLEDYTCLQLSLYKLSIEVLHLKINVTNKLKQPDFISFEPYYSR